MLNSNSSKLIEAVSSINPNSVIPALERGLEIERLLLRIDASDEARQRIEDIQTLLTFLHMRRLGI